MLLRLSKRYASRTGAAILFALLLLLCPLLICAADLTSFAIISDTHVGTEDSFYAAFIRIVDEQRIKVVIHTGDAIHDPGNTEQWKRFLEITGTGKRIHLAPGNHDIRGKESFSVYLRYFKRPYHSFAHGDTLFILLNTEIPGEEGMVKGEQLAWLKAELERHFRYKFVFLHRPLFPLIPLHGLDRHRKARDRLHQLFEQKGVSLVVCGHDHIYNRSMRDSIIYVIAAGSGGQQRFPVFRETGRSFRYIVAARTGKGYTFVVKDIEGDTGDEFTVIR